jgi:hypothetical protein
VIPLLLFASAAAQFSGTWIFESEGRHALILTLDEKGGSLVRPKTFDIDDDGDVRRIGGEWARSDVKWTRSAGEFRAGDTTYRIAMVDAEHAMLAPTEVPWMTVRLRRARPSEPMTLPAAWTEREYAPEIAALRKQLHTMVEADQAPRLSKTISAQAMMEIDRQHRPDLERIFGEYGWPRRSVIGKDAAHDFWLLVQHQPLDFQERLLPEMERAMQQGEASRSDYAYLYDRVRIGQGKPQRWGSQAKCVNGLPVLSPVEDEAGLDTRRRELRMPPIAVYLQLMKNMCRGMR